MISKLENMDYERDAAKAVTWLACVALVLAAVAVRGGVVLTPDVSLSGYATTGAVAAVRAEVEAAASPKLTMVPTGTTVISTDTTVQVVPTRGIYNLYMTGDSDISFDLSAIDITNNVARWETWIKVFSPGMTVGLPSTNAVQYIETPDLTTTTANELMQVSWQAWMDGTNLMMQGHLYNRNTQMPPPTLAELRTYHYGSPTIEESPDEWFAFDSGTREITGFNYETGRENVVIPWEIGGVAVEVIDYQAFSPNEIGHPITSVVAGKSVLSIGESAFNGCSSLTSVSLPVATSIGDSAFNGCSSLTSVSLPVATSIGESAFNGCYSLTSVSLPVATRIEANTFYSCSSLTSVTLPDATYIGYNAFNGCSSLTSVSLPVATSIGDNAFQYCSFLTSVTLPAATDIGSYAFDGCGSLTSATLPAATYIGNSAFAYCTSLTSIYFGEEPNGGGSDVMFDGVPANQVTIYILGHISGPVWGGMPTAPYTP